jgi:hypothetical protein
VPATKVVRGVSDQRIFRCGAGSAPVGFNPIDAAQAVAEGERWRCGVNFPLGGPSRILTGACRIIRHALSRRANRASLDPVMAVSAIGHRFAGADLVRKRWIGGLQSGRRGWLPERYIPPGAVRSKPKTPRAGRFWLGGLAAAWPCSNLNEAQAKRTSTSLDVARRRGPWVRALVCAYCASRGAARTESVPRALVFSMRARRDDS